MKICRTEAKKIIAKERVALISVEEAEKILPEYWIYEGEAEIHEDIANGELPELPSDLIKLMVNGEELDLTNIEIYAPLLKDWKFFELNYSTNKYLEDSLSSYGKGYKVEGAVEEAGQCPCCKYYSIESGEGGLWDICPVCFWENGGDGPNHMFLKDAQDNFERIGAMSERHLDFIDVDGPKKYARNS